MLRIDITPGQEVMEAITASLQEHEIAAGTMTLIGAVDVATISTMPAHDAPVRPAHPPPAASAQHDGPTSRSHSGVYSALL